MLKSLPIWQQNHLNECIRLNLFKNKDVLEVGGITNYKITKEVLNTNSWISFDPSFKKDFKNEFWEHKNIYVQDFKSDKKYDFIIATNSFEHIHNFNIVFDKLYDLLKPGGKLSALFGPIWSCYKGHHVYINSDVNFNNIRIPNWSHLLYSYEEINHILMQQYNKDIVNKLMIQFNNWNFLNHMFYDDYYNLIHNSKFKVLEFRDWHTSIYPDNKTQKTLEEKYNRKNFSTVSIKILLEK